MVLENSKYKRKCEEKSYQLDSASSGVMSGFDESVFLDVVVIILLLRDWCLLHTAFSKAATPIAPSAGYVWPFYLQLFLQLASSFKLCWSTVGPRVIFKNP